MRDKTMDRRTFFKGALHRLVIAAPLAAAAGVAWRYLSVPLKIRPERKVLLGPLKALPQGVRMLREAGIALIRKEEKLNAVSLTCTHLGCTVGRSADGFVCPCHGSRFDTEGALLEGPATRPLDTYPVWVEDDTRVFADLGRPGEKERG